MRFLGLFFRVRVGTHVGIAVIVATAFLAGSARAARGPDASGTTGVVPAANASVSSNWAGYVATGLGSTLTTASVSESYSDVTGQWVEPKATCDGTPTSAAIWVGLGGYSVSSQELEQAGTSADCLANGSASYYAWYELVPANSVDIKLKIDPGDTIASAVVVNGGKVLVQITDRTRGTRFTKRIPMANPDVTSAEWITEAPSECGSNVNCQQVALTDFGAVEFTRTYAIGNGVAGTITSPSWTATAIQLVPASNRAFGGPNASPGAAGAGAMPGVLASDGSGFGVEWLANASVTSS